MAYDVLILPSALRNIEDLPRAVRGRVMVKIGSLAQDPRPPGVKKLKGSDDLYRVRVGDYRIIYRTVADAAPRCRVYFTWSNAPTLDGEPSVTVPVTVTPRTERGSRRRRPQPIIGA